MSPYAGANNISARENSILGSKEAENLLWSSGLLDGTYE